MQTVDEPSVTAATAGVVPILRPWQRRSEDCAVVAGFLGRRGGVSIGAYASMNLSEHVGDDPASVEENWRRLRAAVAGIGPLARVNQVHGNAVRVATRENVSDRPRADGIVTREPNLTLAIFTADCVPILLVSPRHRVVGALHAGWRGVIAGIAREGVAAMAQLGAPAGSIRVALGPSIGPCCFEVDRDLADRFAAQIPGSAGHTRAGREGKAYLDLRAILRDQLIAAGVAAAAIESVGPCTRCACGEYFSRRAAGGVATGLQMSFVVLREE